MEDLPDRVWVTDKVRTHEADLKKELDELHQEIEDNMVIHGITRTISSVTLPKDASHFQKERELCLKRVLEVCEAQPLIIQAELMQEELQGATNFEYTSDSLPLLLHQYFVDRIQQIVQCKHMHMLRWKRFCEHTSTIEALYPLYNKRLAHIISEYNDCIARSQRLAVARESYMAKAKAAVQAVQLDDLLIYLRHLVCHLHSLKKFNQYLKVIEWMPVTHRTEIVPDTKLPKEDESALTARIPARYQDESSFMARPSSASSRPPSAQRPFLITEPPQPPPLNPTLLTSNPITAAQLNYAAAASGGGIASDEHNLGLPLNQTDLDCLRPMLNFLSHLYSIGMNVESISSSADEMELYAAVNRKFRQVYTRQEHMKSFKTYDRIEKVGQENWGADHSMHALKQESNWTEFIQLQPHRDAIQEKKMVELRTRDNVDELLKVQAKFLHVIDSEKVQDALREHAAMVRDPRPINAVRVTSHRTSYQTHQIWKKIYTNPELHAKVKEVDDTNVTDFDFDEKDVENVTFNKQRSPSARKRKDSYDYVDTVQLLGLDEGSTDSDDPASLQGAYLSFLQLRHLRTRDLQRTCLSILNYFRSLERTLTINDGGLSLESGKLSSSSSQNHRKTVGDGSMGTGGALGSHQYIHNTPTDYKVSESEFMEFSDVENHDDFYIVDEGRVHVQDQRGYYIVYDTAIADLKTLENDLVLIASHFITKDRDHRMESAMSKSQRKNAPQHGDVEIASYSHNDIDRFAVLLDLWSNEAAFLECKKELLDCYMEAYQHVFDRDEKRRLAQVMTDIMHQRPRFDFSSHYFVRSYRLECIILRHKSQLVKTVLDTQIEEQREYIQKVCREGDSDFGLPHKVIPKQPISVNMSRSALRNVYMLEFHPSLAIASRIPETISHAFSELVHIHKPQSVIDTLVLEKKLVEHALTEWEDLPVLGYSYSAQVQKDLFSDVFVEDPLFINEIAQTLVAQVETTQQRAAPKERHMSMVGAVGRLLELITTRYRLVESAWESEVLSGVYRVQAKEMGYDECHLFLRIVQFEFAPFKHEAGKPPPVFISSILEDESGVDRYVPNTLYLAIHELDEGHVGRFSFRSRDGILQVLKLSGLESLQTVLAAQIVHKNALISAVTQANMCLPSSEPSKSIVTGRPVSCDSKDENKKGPAVVEVKVSHPVSSQMPGRSPDAFVSLQLEKTPSRDLVTNEFVNKKAGMSTLLKNPEESAKLKRKLIMEFCYRFNQRIAQYSLRSQIISYYNSILGLLDDFPNVRDTYFVLGDLNEKKGENDSVKGLVSDPSKTEILERILRKRPRRVLSQDGQYVLNLWFIPHHSELLIMFKDMDDASCRRALNFHLRVVSAIHDILQYLCAHSRLGSSHARLGSKKVEFVSADWGGTEGIGAELREIQKQLDHLDDRTDPEQVCTFLALRRDVMFLEFDTAVRHSMRDTFLATGNESAYKAISNCMHFALDFLSNTQKESLASLYLAVPEPLEARDYDAQVLFPWRSFINRYGPFPVHFWQWSQIENSLQLCLAGLKEVDRHVANGEILGVSLLMEDALTMGNHDRAVTMEGENGEKLPEDNGSSGLGGRRTSSLSRAPSSRPPSSLDFGRKDKGAKRPLSRTEQPIDAYKMLKNFLLLWKRLEILKYNWGCHRLQVPAIHSTHNFKDFCKEYKKEVLFPVLASVARRYGQGEMYEGLVSDSEPIVIPKGASETEIRVRQLVKILETLECHMINETIKKLNKEKNLALTERTREESALPTDLWKRPSIKESFTINKPHIAEDFITKLMSEKEETEDTVTFDKEHLNACVLSLATEVMAREKQNYESYSMYYENLLRVHHQLLYNKEQEVKQLKDQVALAKCNMEVEVNCHLADRSQDLLLEITALRAKVTEMEKKSANMELDLRQKMKEEYNGLINNLFSCTFDLKKKFDEYRENIHQDVMDKIEVVRSKAYEELSKVQQKSGSQTDTEESNRLALHSQQLHNIRGQNHQLSVLLTKMKVMNNWQQAHSRISCSKKIAEMAREADKSKSHLIEIEMVAKEKIILLREQMLALRNALRLSETEAMQIKKELEKERNDTDMDGNLDELEDKEVKLRQLTEEQDKSRKLHLLMNDKIKKDVSTIKKQLTHERTLKMDAFTRVDELQTQIYDIETGILPVKARPQTAMGNRTIETASSPARPKTATGTVRLKPRLSSSKPRNGALSSSGGVWPPAVTWPANRSPSPVPHIDRKAGMIRPKTTIGRLRSRIADQLLNDLEPPDHYETLVRLKELQGSKENLF